MMYEIGPNGLKPLTTTGKNDLQKGQVIEWRGPYEHKSVIVKNLGINTYNPSYGTKYQVINLNTMNISFLNAYNLVNEDDPNLWHTQHNYILNETYPDDKTDKLFEEATDKRLKANIRHEKLEAEREALIVKGKELFNKYIPSSAKALIVAEREIDDCDFQTDYFSTKTGEVVILGYSSHKRDIFSEMRKHANKIEETKHLSEKNPDYEHREKYSMGAGYYLKASDRYSTGWKICKEIKWSDSWSEGLYVSIAKRCIFK